MTARTVRIWGAATATVAAAAIGLLPSVSSAVVALAAGGLGVVGLVAVLIHRALPLVGTARTAQPPRPNEVPGDETPELRVARVLFYLGCLTVAESSFRRAGLTVSEILFIAAFAVCVLAALRGAPVVALPAPVLATVGVFVFGGAISSAGAQSASGSAYQVLHAAYVLLLWPTVGAMVLRRRNHLLTAIALWATSAAIDGAGAIAQLVGFPLPGLGYGGARMTAFTTDPNDLGGATGIALVPALLAASAHGVTRFEHMRSWHVLRWVPVGLTAIGLMLSGSVAGMAGAAVALVLWLSCASAPRAARAAVVVAAVCSLAVIVLFAGQVTSPVQRLVQVTSPASQGPNGSAQDRLAVARQALTGIERNPFVGKGLDNYDSQVTILSHGYSVDYQVHGLPLAAWYELGIFGVIGVMALLLVESVIGWRMTRLAATDDERGIAWAIASAFVAFVVVSMTQPMVFQQFGWIAPVMLLGWALRGDAVPARAPQRLVRPATPLTHVPDGFTYG